MDFSKVLIHCSSLGCLFTEPRSVEDKKKGNLSQTAKTHLIKVYAKEYWGREKRIETKQMAKGTQQEQLGVEFLAEMDGLPYYKNTITLENDYIIGTPDIIYVPTLTIIDLKLSWEADTFLPKIVEPLDTMYFAQLQGYLYLSGMDNGKVSYGLVDATEKQVMDEKRKLLYQMDVVSEESPEYVKACLEIDRNMTYADLPKHERLIHKTCNRDEEFIKQIPGKVKKAREFLAEFHELHTKSKRSSELLIKI